MMQDKKFISQKDIRLNTDMALTVANALRDEIQRSTHYRDNPKDEEGNEVPLSVYRSRLEAARDAILTQLRDELDERAMQFKPGDIVRLASNVLPPSRRIKLPAFRQGMEGKVIGHVQREQATMVEVSFHLPFVDLFGETWMRKDNVPEFSYYFHPWELSKIEPETPYTLSIGDSYEMATEETE